MCSGCSGDYAGDFEDAGEPGADSGEVNWETWNCGEPDQCRSQRNSEKARAFEGDPSPRGEWQSATAPRVNDQHAADACEILVSGTRIIEIRMIEANNGELKRMDNIGTANGPRGRHHSAEARAKYYQTRREGGEKSSNHARRAFFPGFSRAMAGIIGFNFNRWLCRAREAFGTRRAKKFCMSTRDLGGGDGIARA